MPRAERIKNSSTKSLARAAADPTQSKISFFKSNTIQGLQAEVKVR